MPATMIETFGWRARVRSMIAWRFARICSMVTPRKAPLIPSARIRTSIFLARRGYTIGWVVEWSGAPAAGLAHLLHATWFGRRDALAVPEEGDVGDAGVLHVIDEQQVDHLPVPIAAGRLQD